MTWVDIVEGVQPWNEMVLTEAQQMAESVGLIEPTGAIIMAAIERVNTRLADHK